MSINIVSIGVFHWDVQRKLSKLQSIPVVGPFVISPIKSIYSVVEIVSSFALGVFAMFANHLFGANMDTFNAFFSMTCGVVSFAYSALNILSLGIISYVAELVLFPALNSRL
jgi:hypothetical protein